MNAVKSIVELITELLENPPTGDVYILSARFNQDNLENYFGKIRMAGRRNTSPDFKLKLELETP